LAKRRLAVPKYFQETHKKRNPLDDGAGAFLGSTKLRPASGIT
jgi:hypothetical protein